MSPWQPVPDSAKRIPRMRAQAQYRFYLLIRTTVTYVTPGLNFLKTLTVHAFYLKLVNNNHIGILDVLLTETMLVTTDNPGPLPLRFLIRQSRAESGPGGIWDDDTKSA